MSEHDFELLHDEWRQSGEPKTLVEWLQESKLERRLSAKELKLFIEWALCKFGATGI